MEYLYGNFTKYEKIHYTVTPAEFFKRINQSIKYKYNKMYCNLFYSQKQVCILIKFGY